MRVPIITRDKHYHTGVRYGWLSPDGLMFRTYDTKEQADSATDGQEYHEGNLPQPLERDHSTH